MIRRDPRAARAITRVSVAVAARYVHDAGAGGQAVCVSDPRALRVLRRALLHVLSIKGAPHLMQVSGEVAAALSGSGAGAAEGQSFHLAVGLDRQGRTAFLLRPLSLEDDPAARHRIGAQTLGDLQCYLRAATPLPPAQPPDPWTAPDEPEALSGTSGPSSDQ